MIIYKGYIGHVVFDDEANIFHGEVVNTRDVVTFQGCSVSELRKSLRVSVEAYLKFCAKRGKEPDKPFSGKFIVRLTPEQHRKIFFAAKKSGQSINKWAVQVLEAFAQQQLASI